MIKISHKTYADGNKFIDLFDDRIVASKLFKKKQTNSTGKVVATSSKTLSSEPATGYGACSQASSTKQAPKCNVCNGLMKKKRGYYCPNSCGKNSK